MSGAPTGPLVLVVDDDEDLRLTVSDSLESVGYRVAAAANGREAMDLLLAGTRPDVILLDLMMPVMDGWAFRAEQRQRAELASIPVIVFTAYGVAPDAAAQLDARGLLRKPVGFEELLAAVERAR